MCQRKLRCGHLHVYRYPLAMLWRTRACLQESLSLHVAVVGRCWSYGGSVQADRTFGGKVRPAYQGAGALPRVPAASASEAAAESAVLYASTAALRAASSCVSAINVSVTDPSPLR